MRRPPNRRVALLAAAMLIAAAGSALSRLPSAEAPGAVLAKLIGEP